MNRRSILKFLGLGSAASVASGSAVALTNNPEVSFSVIMERVSLVKRLGFEICYLSEDAYMGKTMACIFPNTYGGDTYIILVNFEELKEPIASIPARLNKIKADCLETYERDWRKSRRAWIDLTDENLKFLKMEIPHAQS